MRRSTHRVMRMAPYWVLTVTLALLATASVVFSLVGEPSMQAFDLVTASVLLAVAVLLPLVGPRVPGGLALDAIVILLVLVSTAGVLIVPDGESQVLVGLGLLLFVSFSAAFRPTVNYAITLALAIISYSVATGINDMVSVHFAIIAVDLIIVGGSLMIHVLVQNQYRTMLSDPLTGTYNRRGLETLAPPLAAGAHRSNTPVSVGVIDLNDFKGYNDRFGHRAGDARLVEVAQAWQEASRRSDLVVRFGGDEFVVVLVGVTPGKADAVAARIPESVRSVCAVGFSRWDPDEDVYDAITRADHVMYRNKPAHR